MKRFFILAFLTAAAVIFASCGATETLGDPQVPAAGVVPSASAAASGEPGPIVIRVACEAHMNVGDMMAWMYEQQNTDVQIEFTEMSPGEGFGGLETGDTQMALFGLNEDELSMYPGVKLTRAFTEGIAIIVNEGNGIEDLTAQQLKGIFTGEITDWRQAGGEAGRITVYPGLSEYTRAALENELGAAFNDEIFNTDYTSYNGDYGCKAVKSDPLGISFTSLGEAQGGGLKAVSVNGAAPARESVLSGQYSLSRVFYIATAGEPDENTQTFIDFCLDNTDLAAYFKDNGCFAE